MVITCTSPDDALQVLPGHSEEIEGTTGWRFIATASSDGDDTLHIIFTSPAGLVRVERLIDDAAAEGGGIYPLGDGVSVLALWRNLDERMCFFLMKNKKLQQIPPK